MSLFLFHYIGVNEGRTQNLIATEKYAKQLVEYHNDYDKHFVSYTEDVRKLGVVVSPYSIDFPKRVLELWEVHDLGNKFRRYEEHVRDGK